MKKLAVAAFALLAAGSAFSQGVNLAVSVGEPGFYGQIDIGHVAPPAVIYAAPLIVARPVVGYIAEPIYLRVPPEHFRHWSRYCDAYRACGRHVYFVQDNWYSRVYAPQYREHGREWYGDHGHDRYEEHGRYERHDERHDDRQDGRGDGRGENHWR